MSMQNFKYLVYLVFLSVHFLCLAENNLPFNVKKSTGRDLAKAIYHTQRDKALNILHNIEPATVNTPWEYRLTSAHTASMKGEIDILLKLQSLGANMNARDKNGNTPIFYAVNLETADTLIKTGADIHIVNEDNRTALYKLLYDGKIDIVLSLLSKGVDPHITDKHKNTLLHIASIKDAIFLAKTLIEQYEVDVNAKNKRLSTPVHLAKTSGMVETLQSLGADIHTLDYKGRSALHRASFHGHISAVEAFVKNTATIHAKDSKKNTPLHFASRGSVVHLLVNHGADIFAKNIFGDTPLQTNVFYKNESSVFALIQRGANSYSPRQFPGDFYTNHIEIANIIANTKQIRENYLQEQIQKNKDLIQWHFNKPQSSIKKILSACAKVFK